MEYIAASDATFLWLFAVVYFVIGFAGYYAWIWWDEKQGNPGSFNGFWGDLFCASMSGLFWSVILFAAIYAKTTETASRIIGVELNPINLLFAASFLFLSGYYGYLYFFSSEDVSILLVLVMLLLSVLYMRGITAPHRPRRDWLMQKMEEDIERKKHPKEKKNP